MRIRNKKPYYLKKKEIAKDTEGGKYDSYSDAPVEIKANIWPASGKIQAEIYGERLKYILNMLYDNPLDISVVDGNVHYISKDGSIDFCEGNGICVYVSKDSKPDYRIISIKQFSHLKIELEKIT